MQANGPPLGTCLMGEGARGKEKEREKERGVGDRKREDRDMKDIKIWR